MLDQARLQNKIQDLILVVCEDYPEREKDFRDALLEYLAQNPDPKSIQDANWGFQSMVELLHEPGLRVRVIEYRVHFQSVSGQIEILSSYKVLHDALHVLEFQCYNLVIQQVRHVAERRRQRLAEQLDLVALATELQSTVEWEELDQPEIDLQEIVKQLRGTEARRWLPASETTWVQELDEAWTEFHTALDNHEVPRLERAGALVGRVIRIRPSQVNNRLFRAARICIWIAWCRLWNRSRGVLLSPAWNRTV